MTDETRNVIFLLRENFSKQVDRRIVLIGEKAVIEEIPQICAEFHIIAKFFVEEQIENSRIMGLRPDIVILAARPEVLENMYQQLFIWCTLNYIQLYSIGGENLFIRFQGNTDICYKFAKNFYDCRHKRIVLYGIGEAAKNIIAKLKDFNIIGVMDKYEKDGWYEGKPIFSYEKVLENQADIIIIPDSDQPSWVYPVIRDFCIYNHIELWDEAGRNLLCSPLESAKVFNKEEPYFEVREGMLREQIDKHDVITFDLFDTLIMRKTLLPEDVFDILEERCHKENLHLNHIAKWRKIAQQNVDVLNPNIYEIYDKLQELTGISHDTSERILELELEIEKSVLTKREKMVEMLFYAIKQGKPVYIISDMYLPAGIIEDIISDLGIKGYKKMLISCDYRICKWEGLYSAFLKEYGKEGASYLHIGDHATADGYCPERENIDSFLIKKGSDMLEMSSYGRIRGYLRTVNERSLVGLFVEKVFNDPFALYHTAGRRWVSETELLGYIFVGPLTTALVIWMAKLAEKKKYDQILFASRDGYLIQRLYKNFVKVIGVTLPEGIYFKTSREVALKTSVMTDKDIEWLCILPYKDGIEQALRKKFHLQEGDIPSYSDTNYNGPVDYGIQNKEIIYKKSGQLRKNYLEYIKGLHLKSDGKYGFFDLVSSGTCMECLQKIFPLDIEGIYLCNYDNPSGKGKGLSIESIFTEHRNVQDNSYASFSCDSYLYGDYKDSSGKVYKNYVFLETVLTAPFPSLYDVGEGGKLIYADENRSSMELEFLRDMQAGICEYFQRFMELYVDDNTIEPKIVDLLYSFKDKEYTNECCPVLDDLSLKDDMGLGQFPVLRH